jgi:hypothetical protein
MGGGRTGEKGSMRCSQIQTKSTTMAPNLRPNQNASLRLYSISEILDSSVTCALRTRHGTDV